MVLARLGSVDRLACEHERLTAPGPRTARQRLYDVADAQPDVPGVGTHQLDDRVDGGAALGEHPLHLVTGRPLELPEQTGPPRPAVQGSQQLGDQIGHAPAAALVYREYEDHGPAPPSERLKATVL